MELDDNILKSDVSQYANTQHEQNQLKLTSSLSSQDCLYFWSNHYHTISL